MLCFGLALVMWCQSPAQAAPAGATFCQVYSPVRWSKNDTRQTKAAVDTLNRKWVRLCRKAKAK